MYRNFHFPLTMTDVEGRFSFYADPGEIFAAVVAVPRGYYDTTRTIGGSQPVLIEGMAELVLPPILLRRGVELNGVVVDAAGRPVPAARVGGRSEFAGRPHRPVAAVTDRQGRFRIDGLPPDTTVHLAAARGDATTGAVLSVLATKGTVTLSIGPENAVAILGRVSDPDGRPIAGAAVRVSARKRDENDLPVEQSTVAFDDEGRTVLHTAADGQFRTPRRLRPDMEYRVEVEADGWLHAATEWIQPSDRKLWYPPAIVLRPTSPIRMVEGRVVDRRALPVGGAVVSQSGDGPARTRTETGPDGRFRLPGVYREPAFLFVEGSGLAFEGHRIGAGDEPIELVVRRDGEPAAGPPLRTLPPVRPRGEEKALARRLIGADLTALTGEVTRESNDLARTLPRVDFDRAWELVENDAVARLGLDGFLRQECAFALSATNLEEGMTVVESSKDPSSRTYFYYKTSDTLPKQQRARKLDLLNKALVCARAGTRAGTKLYALGRIGVRLLELGEVELGTQVLREGQRLAEYAAQARGPARTRRGARPGPRRVRRQAGPD